MSTEIDSIVKGSPLPTVHIPNLGTSPVLSEKPAGVPGDPTSRSPDSPSMIYLNLLILEASLRAQYLELRARRRHHTFFLTLLSAWILGFGYALFLAPREDGRGHGGSVYWGVEMAEKLCFLGGCVTAVLVWATGIWERGVRWPRKWFAVSNRGLRGFNCKLVLAGRPWWAELLSTLGFFLTYGLFSHTASSSYRHVEPAVLREVEKELNLSGFGSDTPHPVLPAVGEDEERSAAAGGGHEEDLAPGGDYVKLLLLAKPFSPNFRENWELYRTEYWEKENERRALVRRKLKERDRRLAKERWGWLWWLPWRRVGQENKSAAAHHGHAHSGHHHHHHHLHGAEAEKALLHRVDKEHRRRGSSVRRGSASSSRSQTPTLELENGAGAGDIGSGGGGVSRKASTASNASDKRRKAGSVGKLSSGSRSKRPGVESRSVTPDIPSPLARESSLGGSSGAGSGTEGGRTLRNSSSRSSIGSVRDKAR